MEPIYWLYLATLAGIVSRTLIPYLVAWQQKPDETKFERKYFLPPLIAVGIAVLASPLVFGLLDGTENPVMAYGVGWAGTDIIREGLKVLGGNVPRLKGVK